MNRPRRKALETTAWHPLKLWALLQGPGMLNSHSLFHTVHISQMRKRRPRNSKGLAQSHMMRQTITARTGPGSRAGPEPACQLSGRYGGVAGTGLTAQNGQALAQARVADAMWNSKPEALIRRPGTSLKLSVTPDRPLTSGASASSPVPQGQNHTCPTCPWAQTMGIKQCWANLSYHPYPVHFCTYILQAV